MNLPRPITIDIVYKKDVSLYTTSNKHSELYLKHLLGREYTPWFNKDKIVFIKALAHAHHWDINIIEEVDEV